MIFYAFINRNYILDLLPEFSIVRNFRKQGFDAYMTDWGMPGVFDKVVTEGHHANNYITNAVDYISEHSNSQKDFIIGLLSGWRPSIQVLGS